MSGFKSLKLSGWIEDKLQSLGVTTPTPIQNACIPEILKGRDCLGVAQTGSGKTMAFALPILHTLAQDPFGIYALVLTPTRELAFQIGDQFRAIGRQAMGLRECVITGGRDMVRQGSELAQRPHVVVATPGRLADHLRSCDTFSLSKIRYLVIDEADRMLDGSFEEPLAEILSALPKKKQTLLFTATVTESLQATLKSVSADPHPFHFEAPSSAATVDRLEQHYVLTPVEALDGYLVHLVQECRDQSPKGQMIIFVKMCKTAEVLARMLNVFRFNAVSLHSNKNQQERLDALAKFRSNQTHILVATDVASRGLDIPMVEFVINHNVPQVSKNYVHRVGRTARAGRGGQAFTLVTPQDVKAVKAVEELIRTQLTEYEVEADKVAEILTQVNVTRREQEIKMDNEQFEERREINRRKKLIRLGLDPDEEERKKRKRLKKLKKSSKKEIAS